MKYKVELEAFEGPMDLLIHLIKESEIDIYDIPINTITEEFLKYLRNMEELNLDIASEFLVMASDLLEIKSKMLLPKEVKEDVEEEDPRKNLVNRILEYKKYKKISEELRVRESIQSKIYYKPKEEVLDETVELELEDMKVDELLKSINNIIKNRTKEEQRLTINEIKREEYTLEECIINVKRNLKDLDSILFTDLLSIDTSREEIITYFLSILELAKLKFLTIRQKSDYSNLILSRRVV